MATERRYPYGLLEGVFRGWWLAIVLAAIGCLVSRSGLPDLAHGLMMASLPDIEESFKLWGKLASTTNLANGMLPSLLALPGAWLVDRYGPRRVALFGLPVVVLGYLTLVGAAPVNWAMYLSVALLTVGASVGFTSVPTAALNHWFHRHKATAMAVPIVAFTLWGWEMDRVTDFLVEGLGWTLAAVLVGVAALALVMPLASQITNRPEDHGLHPDGKAPEPDVVLPEYTWGEAVRTRAFWLLALRDACIVAIGIGLLPLSSRVEFSLDRSAIQWDPTTWIRVVAVLACALLADRMPIRYVLLGLALVMAAAVALLMTGTAVGLFLFQIMSAVAWGGGTAVSVAARGIHFGRGSFATIVATGALVVLPLQPLATFGILNLLELTGGATIPLLLGLAVCLASAWAYWLVGAPRLATSQRSNSAD